jgi:hypothetical protein
MTCVVSDGGICHEHGFFSPSGISHEHGVFLFFFSPCEFRMRKEKGHNTCKKRYQMVTMNRSKVLHMKE